MESDKLSVLLVSTLCSENKYREVIETRTVPSLDPSQRLFSALVNGLSKNWCEVTCISVRPFSSRNTVRKLFSSEEETIDSVRYIYPQFRTSMVYRIIDIYANTSKEVQNWITLTQNNNQIIICDSLVAMSTIPARKIGAKMGIRTIAYVTDYPTLATSIKGKQNIIRRFLQYVFDKVAEIDLSCYDAYIVVAEKLKKLIANEKADYLVIEDLINTDNIKFNRKVPNGPFTFMYGGALCKRFGINKLVDAVALLTNTDIRMVFYGSGESVDYIKRKSQVDNRIIYGGVLTFAKLQEEQKKADILVNPRPSTEKFAAYSFPSKTLSYMLSGTPVLSTRIPGIPSDYAPYLMWLEKESTQDIAEQIDRISKISRADLYEKGKVSFDFAVKNKNHISQTKRIKDYLNFIVNS